MIRPFNLRDLALVHRLGEQGVSLHTQPALTNNLHPLRGALFSLVGGDFPTYVWKAKNGAASGFIQLSLEDDSQYAHILYLSSSAESDEEDGAEMALGRINETVWLSLLDQAVIEIGRWGIHNLVAEVNETGDEMPTLRRAGFAVYTRQDIWMRLDLADIPESPVKLRARRPADDWDVQLLYANTVPRLVQLVEPAPPLYRGSSWVLREGNELAAFAHMHTGTAGTWLRLFIHPNAEAMADDIVTAALDAAPHKSGHPVYCCVRRYQSWLQNPLQRAGFTLWGSQAVMVKHTVQHLKKPLTELTAVLDTQGMPASAPFVQRYEQYGRTGVNGRKRKK